MQIEKITNKEICEKIRDFAEFMGKVLSNYDFENKEAFGKLIGLSQKLFFWSGYFNSKKEDEGCKTEKNT